MGLFPAPHEHLGAQIKRLFLIILFSKALLASGMANAVSATSCETLTISGNPEYPPLLWRESDDTDKLIGVVPALLKDILEPMGIQAKVEYVGSWARVQRLARTGMIDLVAGAFLTSERIRYMDYIVPPIIDLPVAVWVPAGKEFDYRRWSDLVGKTGTTLIGNSLGQEFDSYAEDNLSITPVRSIKQSFLMAQAGRVDYVLYEKLQGQAKLGRNGKGDQFLAMETPVSSESLFFSFPKESACNTYEFRQKFAYSLYELIEAGRVDELRVEYLERYNQLNP